MSKLQQSLSRPMFAVGTQVRVRSGIADPDYPEMVLSGWAGSVLQVGEGAPTRYLVRWSPQTLESIRPAYQKRCQQDDFVFDQMWLLEDDLQPKRGGQLSMRRPTDVFGRSPRH